MANYLVIGGGSGFGKAIAKDLLSNHNVWATYHTTQLDFTPTHMQRLNVLDKELIIELPQVLDGLVYAVGNIPLGGFHRSSPEDFLKDYSLQVLGAIKVLQRALPALKRSENPSVVLFSSVAGKKGYGFHSVVSTHKAALEGLVRSLAAEFAPRIRFNCIAPGLSETPLASRLLDSPEKKEKMAQRNPMKRIGSSKDASSLCRFLLSEEASWITGQCIALDGGESTLGI